MCLMLIWRPHPFHDTTRYRLRVRQVRDGLAGELHQVLPSIHRHVYQAAKYHGSKDPVKQRGGSEPLHQRFTPKPINAMHAMVKLCGSVTTESCSSLTFRQLSEILASHQRRKCAMQMLAGSAYQAFTLLNR